MSGSIIPTPAYKATDWQNFGTQVEKQRLGFIALSLTNYDNNSLPQIAAGSVVEISGSLFSFSSNDSIGGTPTSSAINYILLEVSGSGDTQTVAGSWTTTAPTWNDAKQGWYDATGNKRYIGKCYYDGTNYTEKMVYSSFRGLSDRNGNEVVAMQVETKSNTTGGSVAAASEADVDVTGFSWDPDAVLAAQFTWGSSGTAQLNSLAYPGTGNTQQLHFVSFTPGANKVTVRIGNTHASTAYYWDNLIVTAAKT